MEREFKLSENANFSYQLIDGREYCNKAREFITSAILESEHLEGMIKKKSKLPLTEAEIFELTEFSNEIINLSTKIDSSSEKLAIEESRMVNIPIVESFKLYYNDDHLSLIVPVEMQAIAMKPIFYDIAGNYIDYPTEKLLERIKSMEQESSGFAGIVSGLFGKRN